MKTIIKKIYHYSNTNLIIFLVSLLFFTKFSYAQKQNTSSVTSEYEIVDISNDLSYEISDLFGNKKVKSKFFEINGKTGTVKLNYNGLEPRIIDKLGISEEGLHLKVTNITNKNTSNKKQNYIIFYGEYGINEIKMMLSFEDRMKYEIIVSDLKNNKIIFDYTGYINNNNADVNNNEYKKNLPISDSRSISEGKLFPKKIDNIGLNVAKKLMNCCSTYGGKDVYAKIDYDKVRIDSKSENYTIPMTVGWYGSISRFHFFIKGKLIIYSDGSKDWIKIRDSGGFKTGCSTGCI